MLLEAKEWLKAKGLPAESKTLHSRSRIGQGAEVEALRASRVVCIVLNKFLIVIENISIERKQNCLNRNISEYNMYIFHIYFYTWFI